MHCFPKTTDEIQPLFKNVMRLLQSRREPVLIMSDLSRKESWKCFHSFASLLLFFLRTKDSIFGNCKAFKLTKSSFLKMHSEYFALPSRDVKFRTYKVSYSASWSLSISRMQKGFEYSLTTMILMFTWLPVMIVQTADTLGWLKYHDDLETTKASDHFTWIHDHLHDHFYIRLTHYKTSSFRPISSLDTN